MFFSGQPCHLGETPALTHSMFIMSPRQCGECGRIGSKQASHSSKLLLPCGESQAFLFGQFSQAHGMRQTRRQSLPWARRWALGIPSLGPPVLGLDTSSRREALVQQITGLRGVQCWLRPFAQEVIKHRMECARTGHGRQQSKGDSRLCQQEADRYDKYLQT